MNRGQPMTLTEAERRGLTTAMDRGIHTFSNGTEYEGWADGNCWECWYWDEDALGAKCALEGASMLHIASPELARLFGWLESSWAWRWLADEKRQIKVPSFHPPDQ